MLFSEEEKIIDFAVPIKDNANVTIVCERYEVKIYDYIMMLNIDALTKDTTMKLMSDHFFILPRNVLK